MKYIPVIFVCLLGITSCRKSDNAGENNGTRLTSIIWDSAGTYSFSYSNNLITSMTEKFLDGVVDSSILHYSNNGSGQSISVNHSIEWFVQSPINYELNSSDLPLLISESFTDSSGIVHEGNIAEFIYLPNTDILDSVHKFYSDTLNFVYKFQYSGQNISKIIEWQKTPLEYVPVATFEYTYDTTANVFRQTDPLLYIFTYPNTGIRGPTMLTATFFAETFSKSTFNSMLISEIYVRDSNNSYKISYRLNSKGKITSETFDNDQLVSIKKYIYE